MEELYWNCNQ